MKTVRNRIKEAVYKLDNKDDDTLDKLLAIAYYMGREEATKEISDKYNALLAEQRRRAEQRRYYKMAREIIGESQMIYSPDYAGEMGSTFGDDLTAL